MRKSRPKKLMDIFKEAKIGVEIGRQGRLLGRTICATAFTDQILWILVALANLVDSGIGGIWLLLQMETQWLRSVLSANSHRWIGEHTLGTEIFESCVTGLLKVVQLTTSWGKVFYKSEESYSSDDLISTTSVLIN